MVKEFFPFIDKHAGVPSQLKLITRLIGNAATGAAWRAAKILCRAPGILNANTSDIVWLNRELLPGTYTLERYIKKPIALDIDDAIWLAKPSGVSTCERLARESSVVLAGNAYLAEWFSKWNSNVHIVPTAIDTERFRPPKPEARSRADIRFALGWTGSRGNYGYLYAIESVLSRFMNDHDGKIVVVAEAPPEFRLIPPERVDYRPWSPATEVSALLDMDVGLMPLPDTPWTRGKCSFKMLQYMSTGLPVIVSPVGMNATVLSKGNIGFAASKDNDWLEALHVICRDQSLSKKMGQTARQIVEENYSAARISKLIANALRSTMNATGTQ